MSPLISIKGGLSSGREMSSLLTWLNEILVMLVEITRLCDLPIFQVGTVAALLEQLLHSRFEVNHSEV